MGIVGANNIQIYRTPRRIGDRKHYLLGGNELLELEALCTSPAVFVSTLAYRPTNLSPG